MSVCRYCPRLLDRDLWFVPALLRQSEERDSNGASAVDVYRASCSDSESLGFHNLQVADILQMDCVDDKWRIAQKFMSLDAMVKERYAQRMRVTPKKYGGYTMMHLVLHFYPQVLELIEPWVGKLLLAE